MTEPKQQPSHAGTAVYRDTPSGREFLVISARNRPKEFVLPKGHIDPGETPSETALRELEEETGCTAEMIASLGIWQFEAGNETVTTAYFLARLIRQDIGAEGRTISWQPYGEAVARLSFAEARATLAAANEEVQRLSGERSPSL